MLRGANPRRQREFEKLERQFKKEHRYPDREEEVAARIVNKQRRMAGETKNEEQKNVEGDSTNNKLPIKDYPKLTLPQIVSRLDSLSASEMRRIRTYEMNHKNRRGIMVRLNRQLHA
jgi:hypothetical protein